MQEIAVIINQQAQNASAIDTYLQLLQEKESDVDIVCTGHLHYANTHVIEKNNGKKCLLLHAGSLSCQRTKDQSNSYYFLDISHSSCHVSLRQYISPGFADVKELRFEKEL